MLLAIEWQNKNASRIFFVRVGEASRQDEGKGKDDGIEILFI